MSKMISKIIIVTLLVIWSINSNAKSHKQAINSSELNDSNSVYYISSSSGYDNNNGTISEPWKTLQKISDVSLQVGDTVFFKNGDRFNGHFVINGSGTKVAPIVITAYGEGEKPIITGKVGAENGGDYQEAILVENNDNIVFEGLEVHNERIHNRTGVEETDAYGIYIHNSGTEVTLYNRIMTIPGPY